MLFTRRNWVLRFSIFLNIVVLLYVGKHFASKNGAVDFIEELQASGRNLASIDISQLPLDPASAGGNSAATKFVIVDNIDSETARGQSNTESKNSPIVPGSDVASSSVISTKKPTKPSSVPTSEESVVMDLREDKNPQQMPEPPQNNNGTLKNLEDVVKCHDKNTDPRTAQRSDFWVLYNYIPATRKFRCHESVTYTTHADYTFLDNLVPLLERWQGPVSLAMHAPGTDFPPTLEAIRYARDCLSPLVSELVTFHVFFWYKTRAQTGSFGRKCDKGFCQLFSACSMGKRVFGCSIQDKGEDPLPSERWQERCPGQRSHPLHSTL